MDAHTIAAADAVCIVAGPEHREELAPVLRELGGGWRAGGELWVMPYIGMLAYDRERKRRNAPLVVQGADFDTFAAAIERSLAAFVDVRALWMILLPDDKREVINRILLADAKTEGRA